MVATANIALRSNFIECFWRQLSDAPVLDAFLTGALASMATSSSVPTLSLFCTITG